jgi:ferrous iron transport protein A
MRTEPESTTLSKLGSGRSARVTAIDGSAGLPQRMAMLGIRRGVDLCVVHGPGARGAVVRVGTARIALGREIIDHIRVSPLEGPTGGQTG